MLILSKGRLAEILDASILVVEAGDSNDLIEATHYAGGSVDRFSFLQILKAEQ